MFNHRDLPKGLTPLIQGRSEQPQRVPFERPTHAHQAWLSAEEKSFGESSPAPGFPLYSQLPKPHERCRFSGLSRSVINGLLKEDLVLSKTLRRPGALRGTRLVHIPSLLRYIDNCPTDFSRPTRQVRITEDENNKAPRVPARGANSNEELARELEGSLHPRGGRPTRKCKSKEEVAHA